MAKFNVLMFAFKEGEVREVEVPLEEVNACKSTDDLLERIFYYGQNDFQPRHMPSVSMGDVIQLDSDLVGGKRNYICLATGWKEMTSKELVEYATVPRRDRVFTLYQGD